MNEPDSHDRRTEATDAGPAGCERQNFELRGRVERFLALRSAWGVLVPSGLSDEKRDIAEAGRSLHARLRAHADRAEPLTDPELAKLDGELGAFESAMRTVALSIPLELLRTTLPGVIDDDRRGVLDLLDLLLGAELGSFDRSGHHIAAIDYVITLLCTTDPSRDATFLHDPVTLTPRLYGLCEQSDVAYDARLPAIEAEFFAAASLESAEERAEAVRALARRKVELGSTYFSPGILRAIVSYNASLLRAGHAEAFDGFEETATTGSDSRGVFESPVVGRVADALRRRLVGEPQQLDPVDRVVWCLDLGYANAAEHETLRTQPAGSADGLEATAIVVGLLSRSSNVLEDELDEIGISATQLAKVWVPELDAAFKQRTTALLAEDYARACALSDLKNKFLYAPMIDVNRENRGTGSSRPRARSESDGEARRSARAIAREAVAEARAAEARDTRALPWKTLARIAVGVVIVLACAGVALQYAMTDGELEHYPQDVLLELSPYLASGRRNGRGSGPAFVGTLHTQTWEALDADAQREAATALVARLRGLGVSQVMIYDAVRSPRIQAFGARPPRILASARPPTPVD